LLHVSGTDIQAEENASGRRRWYKKYNKTYQLTSANFIKCGKRN
jgi:hypothetical protein